MIIIHGLFLIDFRYPIYRNSNKKISDFPIKFRNILHYYKSKFEEQKILSHDKELEFTLGIFDNIYAIAIVHPKDNFSRKIGVSIVKGRISRMMTKGYDTLPEWIYIEGEE